MKWWQAAAKGVGDQYLSIRDQEREHNSRMAQIKQQGLIDQAKADKINAAKFNTSFGDDYTLKDVDGTGDMWNDRRNRVNSFKAGFREWFYDGDVFNKERYENFKTQDSQNHQKMLDEWSGRMYQYMLPTESTKPLAAGEESRLKYNTVEYDMFKDAEDFYNKSLSLDAPRALTNVTQVVKNAAGDNIVQMFDAVEATDENKLTSLEGRAPDEVVNSPQRETIEKIALAMKPVLTHGMYGGEGLFKSEDEYDKLVLGYDANNNGVIDAGEGGAYEHVAVIGNIVWNRQNKTGGIETDAHMNEELAQAQIYYGLSNKDMLQAMNQMMPKFKIITHSGGKKEIVRMKGLTQTEISASGQGLKAQFRLNRIAKDLLKEIDLQNRTGLALGIDQLLWGIFGKDGQAAQLLSVAGEYFSSIGKAGTTFEENDRSGILWDDMIKIKNYDKRENWRKDQGATIDYLTITLAYNLALSEQGTGGGKAISDTDYKKAYDRVHKMIGTVGQNKALLKKLLVTNSKDLMISHIETEDDFAKTSKDLIKWWEGYGDNFDRVVQRYTDKLKDNPVFGGVMTPSLDADNQPIINADGTQKFDILEKYEDESGKEVKFRYDGRLSRLFTIDFGEDPDLSAEPGTQRLWDSLGEHEKLVLRPDDKHMDKYWSIFGDKKIQTQTRTAEQILDEGTEDEMDETKIIGDISKYESRNFWETNENPDGIINAHLEELMGTDKNTGVWAVMTEAFPELGSEGYSDFGFKRVRNNYQIKMHSAREPIPDEVQKIFIKIDAMNNALAKGAKYKIAQSEMEEKDE